MKWLRLYSDCVVRVRTDCYVWQSPSALGGRQEPRLN